MVGDNIDSDVRRALDVGVQSIHLRDPAATKRRMQLEMLQRLARRNSYWRGALAEAIIDSSVQRPPPTGSENYQLGQTLAPAFISFVESILEHAEREAVPAVYFCAREGLTFYRMARALRKRRGAGPELRYIGVSRRATFLPSMAGLSRAELDRFLQQYTTLSGRQLLDSISLPIETFGPRLVAAGFEDLDVPVEGMANSPALARFLDDHEVQSMFESRQSEARQSLVEYLRQERFFQHPRVLVVDIGWKGSIIDNLVRAIQHVDGAPAVSALLFGAQEQASNEVCTKRGYFFHGPERDAFTQTGMTNVALFEIFATAGHGSVDGYARRGNRVRPVLRTIPEEREAWQETVAEGQRAVRSYFRRHLAARDLLRSAYDTSVEEWRPYQQDRVRRLVHYPTRGEVDAFMRMKHVESFGVFSVRHFAKERPILQRNGDQPRLLPRLSEIYRSVRWTVWPAGMMGRLGLSWLNPVYDVVDTWHRTHRF